MFFINYDLSNGWGTVSNVMAHKIDKLCVKSSYILKTLIEKIENTGFDDER
jgi:hypothetical protein